MNIRKDDMVEVITGDDAEPGQAPRPRAARAPRREQDRGRRHQPGLQAPEAEPPQSQGGRLSKEMPIDVSNVMLYCPTCRRGVRVGRRYAADGRKERYCKKCGTGLGHR